MAKIFFSYSHRDEELRNELEVHLAMLKRQGLITAWHDRRIGAGNDLHSATSAELEKADIILLFVSAHFLASDYCYEKEMARALERGQEGTARVIPIIIHPCDWHSAPFGNLLATPQDGKPVSMFANQNEALLQVAKEIRGAVEELGLIPKDRVTPNQHCSIPSVIGVGPRSSNLRVKKEFTDHEIDNYLEESFKYIARYFEASLSELQDRNRNITVKYKVIDANCFTASIYDNGTRTAECTIWTRDGSSFPGDIMYCNGVTTSRNQYNESLSIESSGCSLGLKPFGMSYSSLSGNVGPLTQEGAAEHYWSMLISPLQ